MRQCLVALSCLLLQIATAYSMSNNGSSLVFEERPSLVPIGRSIVGLKSDFGRSSDFLNSRGEKTELGAPFSEKINRLGEVVERRYQVSADYTQFTPYWGYGLTSTWSVFAAVPIKHVSSRARSEYTSSAKLLTQATGEEIFKERDRSGLRAPVSDQEDTIVGQFFFVSQLELVHEAEAEVIFSQKLRVPTGETDSLEYYTSGSPEASGYGIELGLLSDFDGPMRTQLLGRVKGALNFDDSMYANTEKGIEKVRRDPGETVEVGAGIEKEVISRVSVTTDYSYIKNFGDRLAENAEAFVESSEAHLMRAALAYRPNPFMSRQRYGGQSYSGRFVYSQVIAGKNIPEYESLGLELSVAY